MDERKKASLARKVVHVLNNTAEFTAEGVYKTKVLGHEGKALKLVDEAADEYDDVIKRLLAEDEWGEKFSEKYIDKALKKLFVTLADEEDIAEAAPGYVQDLVEKLGGYSRRPTTYVRQCLERFSYVSQGAEIDGALRNGETRIR